MEGSGAVEKEWIISESRNMLRSNAGEWVLKLWADRDEVARRTIREDDFSAVASGSQKKDQNKSCHGGNVAAIP